MIASGGQGEDEGISEAECIRRGLVARGVPEERILLESLSTSTRENLRFSLEKLENPDELSIGVVTNNFHVFRAMKIAAFAAQRRDVRRAGGHVAVQSAPLPAARILRHLRRLRHRRVVTFD